MHGLRIACPHTHTHTRGSDAVGDGKRVERSVSETAVVLYQTDMNVSHEVSTLFQRATVRICSSNNNSFLCVFDRVCVRCMLCVLCTPADASTHARAHTLLRTTIPRLMLQAALRPLVRGYGSGVLRFDTEAAMQRCSKAARMSARRLSSKKKQRKHLKKKKKKKEKRGRTCSDCVEAGVSPRVCARTKERR